MKHLTTSLKVARPTSLHTESVYATLVVRDSSSKRAIIIVENKLTGTALCRRNSQCVFWKVEIGVYECWHGASLVFRLVVTASRMLKRRWCRGIWPQNRSLSRWKSWCHPQQHTLKSETVQQATLWGSIHSETWSQLPKRRGGCNSIKMSLGSAQRSFQKHPQSAQSKT